ncbi:kinesin-like protein KIF16B [Clytia hemisphaerica]|uniref:Kinesin-like protein KIF16B n=1 Tax=Clytia hemisphaerica TaxID=252671 RepID=A0A7M5X1B0_9CNID
MASVKVAVRVRPLNKREINMNSKCIIQMEGKRTSILNLKSNTGTYRSNETEEVERDRVKDFFFDYSYWSMDPNSSKFASQAQVYSDLGNDVVNSAKEGYNACIFAYGQTGSGKTHTMMGQQGNEGLIPRICENLFQQMHEKENDGISFRAEVSYLEIYNERVRDLLRAHQPKSGQPSHTLKVREHPQGGPYVQGLTKHMVTDYNAIEAIMKQGNELRTTASTNMNDTSSRSHAIFTVNFTQAKFMHDMPSETTSKINLVDLAGSERADSTGATGVRLKEGANINKSLVTLGSVISSLAEASTNTKKKNVFIPYRDSVLTWLLKDSLGGNSKTIMIAAISPADVNYAETLSTLRYANRAKNIINKPTVNEDSNVKLIRDLRAEIEKLKFIIGDDVLSDAEKIAARKLHENEERLGVLTDKWKDRWKEMQKIMQERELAFQHSLDAGIRMESELPHLIALEDDLLSTGILLYPLKDGKTFVGTKNSKTKPDIVIDGTDILNEHCVIENNNGFVLLNPFPDAVCLVNGTHAEKKIRLKQGDVVTFGTTIFRFNHPKEAEELREKRKSVGPNFSELTTVTKYRSESDLQKIRSFEPRDNKREEDLSRQLDEARLLLEKQKQEEERRMEETRNEFARQIREESQRLQETRGELEQQRRARLNEVQTPQQIKKHIEELERKHTEAEKKRQQRQKELSESINAKKESITLQEKKLKELEQKCSDVKSNDTTRIENEVHVFMKNRSELMTTMSNDIQKIVTDMRAKSGDSNIDQIRSVWETETNRIETQEKLCSTLRNELESLNTTLENMGNVTDEDKMNIEQQKSDLERTLKNADVSLEEALNNKAESLAKYGQDYKNRYEFICWEREKVTGQTHLKKEKINVEKAQHEECFLEAEGVLDEVKTKYYEAVTLENEMISQERLKVDQRKKESIKQSILDQRECNEKVQQYRMLLTKRQEKINSKRIEMESIRNDLTEAMKGKTDDSRKKADRLRMELNDKIEDVHELEKNHDIMKSEEERVIQNMLSELNDKKKRHEIETETSENILKEFEQVSREKVLLLQEEVDMAEKSVIQCRSVIERDEGKLKDIDKLHEAETAKLDTDLLYVGYLIDKEFPKDSDSEELAGVLESKQTLEVLNENYKQKIESIKAETDSTWKPLVESREEAQVVLEDLVRTRGIAEVTLTELKEQFLQERQTELTEIEQLKERLGDLIEEQDLSRSSLEDEVLKDETKDEQVSFNRRLDEEKQKLEDEMYEKILIMEKAMQSEIDQLKERELDLITCMQSDREKIVEEKRALEQSKESATEGYQKIKSQIEDREKELEATREVATREIEELKTKLSYANKEIYTLQEKLEKYVSLTSLDLDKRNSEDDDLSDTEVKQLLYRVNESSGIEEEDDEIARFRVSPPPTPINRFLQSVSIYRKNQIKVTLPRFILRGFGRASYHVFEVKLSVGDDCWSVYRRYRRFRELHRAMLQQYSIVANIEFPSRRYFGNKAERFVRVRRSQLEAYLTALLAIVSNMNGSCIYAVTDRQLTKQDLGNFHPFFKQGVYEYTKNETDFSP